MERANGDRMKRHTILVVDDEPNSLSVIKSLLEEEYEVLTASSGREGLDVFSHSHVDMVIADQRMPDMSGIEMLLAMKRVNGDCVRIVLTAYADFDAVLTACNQGDVYRFVLKPWNPEEMSIAIRQALEHRDALRGREHLLVRLERQNRELIETAQELRKAQDSLVNSEKLAAVGKLAGDMLHELKNQLFLAMLAEEYKKKYWYDGDLVRFLDSIVGLNDIVADMLDGYRHYVRGRLPTLNLGEEDLEKILVEVVALTSSAAYASERKIEYAGGEPLLLVCDRHKVKRVLTNLVRNACEALAPGGRVVLQRRIDGDEVVVEVQDSGTGIAPELIEKVWEPFFSTKGEAGLGLGLDLCRNFVNAHGGNATCSSEYGKGSTFTIRLPLGGPGRIGPL